MASEAPIVAVLGGSLSGNKGAASMVLAVDDGLRRRIPEAHVRLFSPYAREDRRQDPQLEVIAFSPLGMIATLPWAMLCLLSGRRWRPRRGTTAALASADVVADVSGIAFMDGRGIVTLTYNVLLVLIPWALGVPVVKMAQALGPFDDPINRLAARWVLRRVRWIGLRGAGTVANSQTLGLENGELAADVAFLLEAGPKAEEAASLELPEEDAVFLLAPSAVVERASVREGIDYAARMTGLAQRLTEAGHDVVVMAHSARQGAEASRTNDLPLCRQIAASSGARVIDREIGAREMRALIGRSRVLVTSRFHAMISGLATRTPTFVVGWSHKYREVLEEFGLQEWALDFRDASEDDLYDAVLRLDSEANRFRASVDARLSEVLADAERNLDQLASVLEETL